MTIAPNLNMQDPAKVKTWVKRPRFPKPENWRPRIKGSLCGAWAASRKHACRLPAGPSGRCRLHGGRSTGPRTVEGKARVGAAVAASWAAWRASMGLPSGWRSRDNQVCRQKRESAAAYLAKHGRGDQS